MSFFILIRFNNRDYLILYKNIQVYLKKKIVLKRTLWLIMVIFIYKNLIMFILKYFNIKVITYRFTRLSKYFLNFIYNKV